jgi:hypothetical protein
MRLAPCDAGPRLDLPSLALPPLPRVRQATRSPALRVVQRATVQRPRSQTKTPSPRWWCTVSGRGETPATVALLCRSEDGAEETRWSSIAEAVDADRTSTPCRDGCLSDHSVVAVVGGRVRVLSIEQGIDLA